MVIEKNYMMKNHRFSVFSLNLSLLFVSLKVSYSCQNFSSQKTRFLDIKEGNRSCRIREGDEKNGEERRGGSGIFFDLFWQLLKIYRSLLALLWIKIKGILGLP